MFLDLLDLLLYFLKVLKEISESEIFLTLSSVCHYLSILISRLAKFVVY